VKSANKVTNSTHNVYPCPLLLALCSSRLKHVGLHSPSPQHRHRLQHPPLQIRNSLYSPNSSSFCPRTRTDISQRPPLLKDVCSVCKNGPRSSSNLPPLREKQSVKKSLHSEREVGVRPLLPAVLSLTRSVSPYLRLPVIQIERLSTSRSLQRTKRPPRGSSYSKELPTLPEELTGQNKHVRLCYSLLISF